ncbi:MAG: sugar transferase [Candidatus Latescibacterota bacterium]|nr:sugar transferase [Candidatus Latescibacterota bacterium]
MSQTWVTLLIVVSDFVGINAATLALLWIKHVGGTLESVRRSWEVLSGDGVPTFLYTLSFYVTDALPMIYACWLVLFIFNGLYRPFYSGSRFDEVIAVFRVVTIGVLLLFIATFDVEEGMTFTRALVGTYWITLLAFVSGGRVVVRSVQVKLLSAGIGRRKALIVGTDDRGVRLLDDLRSSPARGYEVVGFVQARGEPISTIDFAGVPVLGTVEQLAKMIADRDVESVLIALRSNSHEEILEIVNAAGSRSVSFGITPDLYDIVAGHVRTNQIYGVPLMELRPQLRAPWESAVKRLIDVAVGLVVMVGLSPLWVLVAVAIKLDSRGSVLFRQERVGRQGRSFTIYKFRSMVVEAEQSTGPVFAQQVDPRVTRMGRLLRAMHLDEIPQCINFLRGDMSLVGPRPERPYFVERFCREIPFYMRRFNVKPGLLGWAQSKHEFDMDSSDLSKIAAERLEYDLYYIENASLILDFKIMLRTIWFVLSGKSTR